MGMIPPRNMKLLYFKEDCRKKQAENAIQGKSLRSRNMEGNASYGTDPCRKSLRERENHCRESSKYKHVK